jgi:hypothetical protein
LIYRDTIWNRILSCGHIEWGLETKWFSFSFAISFVTPFTYINFLFVTPFNVLWHGHNGLMRSKTF